MSREVFTPSEQWRVAFEQQATRGMLEKLHRIARARLGAYCGGRHRVQDADVEDVVIAALGDTWTGTLAWDPEQKTLFSHLKDAVKFRVRNEAHVARRRPQHDEFEEDDCGESLAGKVAAGAIVPTVTSGDGEDDMVSGIADEVIGALRLHAARDVDVMSLLEALARRVVDRDDVLEETGMTVTEYNNAWRRLGRLARELPAQLRDHALSALA